MVLTFRHALSAHEALGRPDALSGFLEVVHRLFEDGVFVGHDRSIRTRIIRSPDCFTFPREREDIVAAIAAGKHQVEVEDFDFTATASMPMLAG